MNNFEVTMFDIDLRDYQDEIDKMINASFAAGNQNVLGVLPTGAGKTILKAHRACVNYAARRKHIVWAHRDFLLVQISMSMALMGVKHTFIANEKTVRFISHLHVQKFGQSMIDDMSPVCISSVGAFINRPVARMIGPLIYEWNLDEAHHLLAAESADEGGIWGRAVNICSNARGLGVTATPIRGDRKGLGRDHHGVFDDLVVGIGMPELIKKGNLTSFKVFAPPNDDVQAEVDKLNVTAGGDYNQKKLARVVDQPTITGNAVEHYKRIADGERAITYCVDIRHCDNVAAEFNAAGIKSLVLSSKNTDSERQKGMAEFQEGRVLNLVNCDLFGEGFDLPAVTTGIMLRPTKSYGLYCQQFGRVLRPMESKVRGNIIDHVSNYWEHGRPDRPPVWSLDGTYTGRGDEDDLEDCICSTCTAIYKPKSPSQLVCDVCGHEETAEESEVSMRRLQRREGTLIELEFDDYAEVEKRLKELNQDNQKYRRRLVAAKGLALGNKIANNHMLQVHALGDLRSYVQSWCETVQMQTGWTPGSVQMQFGKVFGVHPVKAQVLPERQAIELTDKLRTYDFNLEDLRL
jgi:DNA repair protein RadD